jgi:hypothetical protein
MFSNNEANLVFKIIEVTVAGEMEGRSHFFLDFWPECL